MKVVSALKKMCEHCITSRKGKKVYIKCKLNPRHKQRQGQGFSSVQNVAPAMKLYYGELPGFYMDLNEFIKRLPYM